MELQSSLTCPPVQEQTEDQPICIPQVQSVEIQTDLALVNLESLAEQFQLEEGTPEPNS